MHNIVNHGCSSGNLGIVHEVIITRPFESQQSVPCFLLFILNKQCLLFTYTSCYVWPTRARALFICLEHHVHDLISLHILLKHSFPACFCTYISLETARIVLPYTE